MDLTIFTLQMRVMFYIRPFELLKFSDPDCGVDHYDDGAINNIAVVDHPHRGVLIFSVGIQSWKHRLPLIKR